MDPTMDGRQLIFGILLIIGAFIASCNGDKVVQEPMIICTETVGPATSEGQVSSYVCEETTPQP